MANRRDFLSSRFLRRRLKDPLDTWEDDGGRVPGAEKAYLVHGHLVRGWIGRIGWWGHRAWKRLSAMFARRPRSTAPRPTF